MMEPGGPPRDARTVIVFVVVIYNIPASHSSTLKSLEASLRGAACSCHHVLVFDNSENPDAASGALMPHSTMVWCGHNRGLAAAYNDALSYCEAHGARVLVTLDQDSTVTPAYISSLLSDIDELRDGVAALCPQIIARGKVVSPFSVDVLGRRSYGRRSGAASAINSFSAYSVRFLREVGGFEEFYWLDALDLSTYARMSRQRMRLCVMDVDVEHDLSLAGGVVGAGRWRNIAYYEACFLLQYAGVLQTLTGLMRLLVRAIRVAPRGSSFAYLLSASAAITRSLGTGPRRRLLGTRAVLQ